MDSEMQDGKVLFKGNPIPADKIDGLNVSK
jgi:hypothetical protein